jgi:hypothetical protein
MVAKAAGGSEFPPDEAENDTSTLEPFSNSHSDGDDDLVPDLADLPVFQKLTKLLAQLLERTSSHRSSLVAVSRTVLCPVEGFLRLSLVLQARRRGPSLEALARGRRLSLELRARVRWIMLRHLARVARERASVVRSTMAMSLKSLLMLCC